MNIETLYKQIVDYLAPLQTPTEQAVYYYLLRHSLLEGQSTVQVGDRTIAKEVSASAKGKLAKTPGLAPSTIASTLRDLQKKGHIVILTIEQKGKVIEIKYPSQISECVEMMQESKTDDIITDYYNDPRGRELVFERDDWRCQYCGEKLNKNNIAIDHYIPQRAGRDNSIENLKTSCISCNSIKSGKSFEEAAPLILQSIRNRNTHNNV